MTWSTLIYRRLKTMGLLESCFAMICWSLAEGHIKGRKDWCVESIISDNHGLRQCFDFFLFFFFLVFDTILESLLSSS